MKTVLVTGAAYGIGRAVATHLSCNGWNTVLTSRSEESLIALSKKLSANGTSSEYMRCDLAKPDDIANLLTHLQSQSISALVHCAAEKTDPERDATLEGTPAEVVSQTIDVTVRGTTLLVKGILPLLSKSEHGALVFVASDWALRGSHGPPVFSASKAYIAQLAHTIRRQSIASGVSVTTIFPGDVASYDADWNEPKWTLDDDVATVQEELGKSRIPLIDIAEAISFVLGRHSCRVDELWLSPVDPAYDY